MIGAGIAASVYLATHPQILKSRAQSAQTQTTDSSTCTPPAAVTNVHIVYPFCSGDQCSFTQAQCTWDSITGAVSYTAKITEVDSNTVIKTDTPSSSTTQTTFPVVSGRTYKCDVTATNQCGASGGTGSDSLLCKAPDLGVSPTPTPSATASASATPAPTPAPTVAPTPAPLTCGSTGCNSATCGGGSVCMQTASGQFYCGLPSYQTACQQSPSIASCCQAPVRTPVLPPAGDDSIVPYLAFGGIAFLVASGLLLMRTRKGKR